MWVEFDVLLIARIVWAESKDASSARLFKGLNKAKDRCFGGLFGLRDQVRGKRVCVISTSNLDTSLLFSNKDFVMLLTKSKKALEINPKPF